MALPGPGFYPEHSLLIPFPPLMWALAVTYSPKLKPKALNYWDWAPPTAVPTSLTSLLALALVFLFGIWEFSLLPFKLSYALKTIVLFYSTYWSIWGYLKCVVRGWGVGNGGQVIFDCHIARTRNPYITYYFWLVVGGSPYSKQSFTFFVIRKYSLQNSVILNRFASVCNYWY